MWSTDLSVDGVRPCCLSVTNEGVWWLSDSGVLYTWRAGSGAARGDPAPTDPIAVAQLDPQVFYIAVSTEGTLMALTPSYLSLWAAHTVSSPCFLQSHSDCPEDDAGQKWTDDVTVTVEEVKRFPCSFSDVYRAVFNSDASLAAICTTAGICVLDCATHEEGHGVEESPDYLCCWSCADLSASTVGCALACFSGLRELVLVDEANHLLLLHCVRQRVHDGDDTAGVEESDEGRQGEIESFKSSPGVFPLAFDGADVTLRLLVDGHLCTRSAKVVALNCRASGLSGTSLVILGISNGTIQVLDGGSLQHLRSWSIAEALPSEVQTAVPTRGEQAARQRGHTQSSTRPRIGISEGATRSTVTPSPPAILDVQTGMSLITVCTAQGVLHYSKSTFQLESSLTYLLPSSPSLSSPSLSSPSTSARPCRVEMAASPTGTWACLRDTENLLYFYPFAVDTQHTLAVRRAAEETATDDIIHAHKPLPPSWLQPGSQAGRASAGVTAAQRGKPAKTISRGTLPASPVQRRSVAKGSGYMEAPWSVQQERKRKAQAAAAKERRTELFGTRSREAPPTQYDATTLFGVSGAALTLMEGASEALRGLHTRAVVDSVFATTGDALLTAGGDGRIQRLQFPIARAKSTDGLVGRVLQSSAVALTAVDANLSRQHQVILSGGADGVLRLWLPGVRDTPLAECTTGGSAGARGGRDSALPMVTAAQFYYLDNFVLSCTGHTLELRRNGSGAIAARNLSLVAPGMEMTEAAVVLSPTPVYTYSVGVGHSITSLAAVNYFASNLIFLSTSEKELQVLDVATNTVLWRNGATHQRGVYRVATGRASRYATSDTSAAAAEHLFLSASLDSTVALWDVRTARPVQLFTQHTNTAIPSLAMAMAPGNGIVAVASQDNAIYVYDLRGGSISGGGARSIIRNLPAYATSMAWHPQRPFFSVGTANGDVRLFQGV